APGLRRGLGGTRPTYVGRMPMRARIPAHRIRHSRIRRTGGLMRSLIVLMAALVGALPSNNLPNPYRLEPFGQLPNGRKLGAASGIDVDRDGKSVWVFERCGGATCDGLTVAPLLKFNSSGLLVASFGAGMFAFP